MQANNAYIRRVDRPQEEPILVALQRLRRCSDEIPDEFWPPAKSKKSTGSNVTRKERVTTQDQPPLPSAEHAVIPESPKEDLSSTTEVSRKPPNKGKYTGFLRCHPRTADADPADM